MKAMGILKEGANVSNSNSPGEEKHISKERNPFSNSWCLGLQKNTKKKNHVSMKERKNQREGEVCFELPMFCTVPRTR